MSEKDVGRLLAKHSPCFLWKTSSDKYGYGTPDRCVLQRGTRRVLQVELKYIPGLPTWSRLVGLKSRQAQWLEEWRRFGGEVYVAVGVGADRVAFFDSGFIEICKHGIERKMYDLMTYDKVEDFLLYGQKP